jgi:zinc protease
MKSKMRKNKSPNLMKILEPVFDMPVSRFMLPNGMLVIHRVIPGGLAAVQLWVKTGSIHEAPMLGSGMSHYLEHMLFKGTSRRNAPQITAEVQAIGGEINAYTTFDRTVYHIESPSEGLDAAMDILCDMAFNSLLDPVELAREREVILREIAMNNDDPDRRLSRKLYETAFRQHAYRFPVIGHAEQFKRIDENTIRNYYKSRYTPDNMVLIVVGDVTPEALEKAIEKTFAKQSRTQGSTPTVPGEPPQLAPRAARIIEDVSICRGFISWRVPGIGSVDAPSLDVLASILGGGESSVLYQALRMRRKLVTDIDVSCWNPGKCGLLIVNYTCDCGEYEKVEAAIGEEIENAIEKGFTKAQLDRALLMTLASEIDSRKTVSGHASRLGLSEVVVGDLFYPRQYFSMLSMLKAQDLAEVARSYIVPATKTTVTMDTSKTGAKAPHLLRKYGHAKPEIFVISNGARVIIQRDSTLPKIHIRYGALGGPLYENNKNHGITALLATLLTRDTARSSAREISDSIEDVGGRFDEFCGNNSFGFAMEMLSSELDTGLEILRNALIEPAFLRETFDIERNSQISRIQECEDDISERGRILLRRAFFGTHPYSEISNGTIDALEKLSPEDVRAHFSRLVRASNSVISICGDFDNSAEIISRIETILGELPSEKFVPMEPDFKGPERIDVSIEMDREQAVIFRSFKGPGVRSEDHFAADMLDEILSDMSGPLFVNARENKALAYFVGASRMIGVNTGMFTLYGGTKSDTINLLRDEFDIVMKNIREHGVSEHQMQRVKTRLKARRRLSMQTIGARANSALLDTLYGLPIMDTERHDSIVDSLTSDDMRDFAVNYLRDDMRVDFAIGPNIRQKATPVMA